MSGIYCKCDRCGAVAKVGGDVDIGGVTLTFNSSLVTCPRCGRFARILDGTYVGGESGMDFARGPDESRAIYAKLRELAEQAKAKKSTNEEFLQDLAEVSGDLAAAMRRVDNGPFRGSLLAIFSIVIILLSHVNLSLNVNFDIDVNDLVDRAIERFEAQQHEPANAAKEAPPPELKMSSEIELKVAEKEARAVRKTKRQARRERGRSGSGHRVHSGSKR